MLSMAEVKTEVLDQLKLLPVCKPDSSHTQWTVRCPYCGDSEDPTHGHLSIKIMIEDDNSPMVYRCFKCDSSGIVTNETLADLGIRLNDEMLDSIRKGNRRAARHNKFTNDRIEPYQVLQPMDSGLVREKLNYIGERLGCRLELADCPRYKIIPDFYQFISANKLTEHMDIDPRLMNTLQNHFVGFLSQSNNVITFRCIRDISNPQYRGLKRYFKLVLNKANMNPASFYLMPTTVDPFGAETLSIHISEGIFDILGVYMMKNRPLDYRSIFAASCGFGPLSIMEYLVRNGLAQKGALHIYCDNDKTDMNIASLLNKRPEITCWFGDVIFHRNKTPGEKDYGVPKDRILDTTRVMYRDGKFIG